MRNRDVQYVDNRGAAAAALRCRTSPKDDSHAIARRSHHVPLPGLLIAPAEEWTPPPSCAHQHFLPPARLKDAHAAADAGPQPGRRRTRTDHGPAGAAAADAGFIDLPQKLLDDHRRKADASDLGRILARAAPAARTRSTASSSSASAARPWVPAPCSRRLRSAYHNELPPEDPPGRAAHLLRGQQRRQRRPAGPARPAANHLRRPRPSARNAGGRRHQQVGRHPGDGGRVSRLSHAKRPSITARTREMLRQLIVPVTGAGGQAPRPVQGRRLSPTTTS